MTAPTINDPADWPVSSAKSIAIGVDIGFSKDHSAAIIGGVWVEGARSIIGVRETIQFELGFPADEVADAIAAKARDYGKPRIIFDASNNSAFASILAARFPANPANYLIAGTITNAAEHAATATVFNVSLLGQRAAIPKWTLSKRQLIESVAAEIDNGSLKIGRTGDWETLRDELAGMERTVRASGNVSYNAPDGRHDDMVMALSLCVFGLRRVGAPPRRIARPRRTAPSVLAWT